MRLWRSAAAGISAAVALSGAPADAQGNVCLELEARLIQIERGGGSGVADDVRAYDTAVAQQRNEIDRAMAEARRAGCVGGFLLFRRQAEPKCPQLIATIDQMRANLNRLMRARGSSAGDPFAVSRERNDLLRSLAQNGCGPSYAANSGFPEPGGLLQSLFGQARYRYPGTEGFLDARGFGTYRTLCVRTCDGYYFPISFSTLPGKFSADAMACQQMCPGTEATLYVHRNPGEDSAAMVSLDGQPYVALPTAFRYRREYDKACTCRSPTPLAAITEFSTPAAPMVGAAVALDYTPQAATVPLPRLRPHGMGEDPETVANRNGRLDPEAAPRPADEELAGVAPDGRKIRVVGPSDFYAQ